MIIIIVGLLLLFILKYDINIKNEWNAVYFTYKTVKRDVYSGEYYDIVVSKKIWTKKEN